MPSPERTRRLAIGLPVIVGFEICIGWLWGWHAVVASVAVAVGWELIARFAGALGRRGFPK